MEVYLVSKYLLSVCHVLVCFMSHLHSCRCQKQFRTPSLMVFTFNEKNEKKNFEKFSTQTQENIFLNQVDKCQTARAKINNGIKCQSWKNETSSEVKRVVGYTAKGKIVLVDRHLHSHSFLIQWFHFRSFRDFCLFV